MYDSAELDSIYKVFYEHVVNGTDFNDVDLSCFPKRCQVGGDSQDAKRTWLKRIPLFYRLIRADDLDSFYTKMGPFGLKPIVNATEVGPPSAEYELHITRLGQWCEVPQKKHYERIFFEGHGPTHSGTNCTGSTI